MFEDKPEEEKRAEDAEESTGSVADEFLIDGRNVGGPYTDADQDDQLESPEHDAEVQSAERGER